MSVLVTSPDGRTWRVRRRWLPRLGGQTLWGRFHRRFRKLVDSMTDVPVGDPGCLDVVGEGFVVVVLVIAAVLFVVFIGLPLALAVLDMVLVLLFAVVGLVARVVFRRPWVVEARAGDGSGHEWRVVGWRRSGRAMDELRQLLAAGADVGSTPTEPSGYSGPPTI
jgi:hypothetical protein